MRGECHATAALVAAMRTFVTISEKRGIVYSEHMPAVAAVMDVAEHGNLDQSGSASGRPCS